MTETSRPRRRTRPLEPRREWRIWARRKAAELRELNERERASAERSESCQVIDLCTASSVDEREWGRAA